MNITQKIAAILCIVVLLTAVTGIRIHAVAEPESLADHSEEILCEASVFEETDAEVSIPEDRLLGFLYRSAAVTAQSSNLMESRLSQYEAELYRRSKEMARLAANGELTETTAAISVDETPLGGTLWSAEQLGVAAVVENNAIHPDAAAAMRSQLNVSFQKVFRAVLADCPYEMYWSSNTYSYAYFSLRASKVNGEWFLSYTGTMRIRYAVSSSYASAGNAYQIDTEKTGRVASAVENAHAIVAEYAGLEDTAKLKAYRDRICALTSYDHSAAILNQYGDPWQLISVFDGDDSTRVVCEGYAKAFQFLCELSQFRSGTQSCLVTGTMKWDGGSGGHMWNVVTQPDGCHVLVDVTNCDIGSTGSDSLFLAYPTEGDVYSGYSVGRYSYRYDERAWMLYSAEELTLSGEPPRVMIGTETLYVDINETAVITTTAAGLGLRYRWQWCSPGGGWRDCTTVTAGSDSPQLMPVGDLRRDGYRYRCKVTDVEGRIAVSTAVTLIVEPDLMLLSSPTDCTAVENGAGVFRAEVSGTGLRYQWQYLNCLDQWVNCTAATSGYNSPELRPTAVSRHDGLQYRCLVTNVHGNRVITEPAVLTVLPSVRLTEQPQNTAVPSNSMAAFTVGAVGTDLHYAWQYQAPGGAWTYCTALTEGYNRATLCPQGTMGRNGYQYRCIVTDAAGNRVTSNPAVLTAVERVIFTLMPQNQTVSKDEKAVFTAAADGEGLLWQWQYRAPGGSWRNCTEATEGAHTDTLRPTASFARSGYSYRCIATDVAGSYAVSNAAMLTVIPKLQLLRQPEDQTVGEDEAAMFAIYAEGDGLHYQWQYMAPDGSWMDCTDSMDGYDTPNLMLASAAQWDGCTFRCIVKDTIANCLISNEAKLFLRQPEATESEDPVTDEMEIEESEAEEAENEAPEQDVPGAEEPAADETEEPADEEPESAEEFEEEETDNDPAESNETETVEAETDEPEKTEE